MSTKNTVHSWIHPCPTLIREPSNIQDVRTQNNVQYYAIIQDLRYVLPWTYLESHSYQHIRRSLPHLTLIINWKKQVSMKYGWAFTCNTMAYMIINPSPARLSHPPRPATPGPGGPALISWCPPAINDPEAASPCPRLPQCKASCLWWEV